MDDRGVDGALFGRPAQRSRIDDPIGLLARTQADVQFRRLGPKTPSTERIGSDCALMQEDADIDLAQEQLLVRTRNSPEDRTRLGRNLRAREVLLKRGRGDDPSGCQKPLERALDIGQRCFVEGQGVFGHPAIEAEKQAPARGAPRAGWVLELRQPLARVVLPSRPKSNRPNFVEVGAI